MKQSEITSRELLCQLISRYAEDYFCSFCNQKGFICEITFPEEKDFCMQILYRGIEYNIQALKREEDYFWHLEPYRQTFFETDLCGIDSFRLVLTAILENK